MDLVCFLEAVPSTPSPHTEGRMHLDAPAWRKGPCLHTGPGKAAPTQRVTNILCSIFGSGEVRGIAEASRKGMGMFYSRKRLTPASLCP